MVCIGRNAIFKWHEHHGKFMVRWKNTRSLHWDLQVFLHGWEKKTGMTGNSSVNEQVFDIGYDTNHHQWRESSNSSLDLSNMISVYFAIHKASKRGTLDHMLSSWIKYPAFMGKIWSPESQDGENSWKARTDAHCQPVHSYKCQTWTTCLSCHFCSFFSNTLGGHTCGCSWHSAYAKSYSHVAMSCGCSWDLSNSQTLRRPCMWPVYINYTESSL